MKFMKSVLCVGMLVRATEIVPPRIFMICAAAACTGKLVLKFHAPPLKGNLKSIV